MRGPLIINAAMMQDTSYAYHTWQYSINQIICRAIFLLLIRNSVITQRLDHDQIGIKIMLESVRYNMSYGLLVIECRIYQSKRAPVNIHRHE